MWAGFGSKRRAKEEILARYASVVYMGHGQYGFARAANYYFGRRLATLTEDDADIAAVLAGIPKSPRDYASSANNTGAVLRRRNHTLTLMRANGFMSLTAMAQAKGRALRIVRRDPGLALQAPAVVGHVLEEFKTRHPDQCLEWSWAPPPKWISNYDGRFKGLIPIRQALAESRNAVAIWITEQIGIDTVLQTSRSLGVRTPLERYPTTALGASEMTLLELANAYRAIASGIVVEPYVIADVVRHSGEVMASSRQKPLPISIDAAALSLIQEGLRGVVRLPSGSAHALAAHGFPVAVMGKTGTTNEFRDAIFVGSTYGPDGITAAFRIGFDDNRSLGSRETGGRVALPVFQEIMLGVYRDQILGHAPAFPVLMEAGITASQLPPQSTLATDAGATPRPGESSPRRPRSSPTETEWLLQHGRTVHTPTFHAPPIMPRQAGGCEPLGCRGQAQRRNIRSLARRSFGA